MTTHETIAPIQRSVEVPLAPEHAFTRFTEKMGVWWPVDLTWSGDGLEGIGIEAGVGGRAWERGPAGRTLVWGRVLAWEPPHRLVLAWLISPNREVIADPAQASEIEVRFDPIGPARTRVMVEHRGFERHGADGAGYREAMAMPQGWDRILDAYADVPGY